MLSVFHGILVAANAYDLKVLLACGMTATQQWEVPNPAWPIVSSETTFVPIGHWNTDGLIVIPPLRSEARSEYLGKLLAQGFPLVYAGAGEPGPSVMSDNTAGIYQAVAHLWDHGHRRIAYIAGFEHIVGDSSLRLQAFHSAMKAHGVEADARLIAYGLHTVDGGRLAMQHLLGNLHPFTAVITSNYGSAVGALDALRSAGRRIPEDVALIAYDDTLDAVAQTPPVTTIHQQTFELGYRAVDLLMEYIRGTRREPTTLYVPEQLIVRRSCGCRSGSAAQSLSPVRRVPPPQPIPAATQLTQAMIAAILPEIDYLRSPRLHALFQEWAEAFLSSGAAGDSSCFEAVLTNLLQQFEAVGEDVHRLHLALSILRDYGGFGAGAQSQFAQDMIEEARSAITETSRQQNARYLTEQEALAEQLGVMTAQLLVTLGEAQILDILAAHLPSLGIRHAQIVMFEPEAEDTVAWSESWKPIPAASAVSRQRFLSRAFPPPGLYPSEEPFKLALLPLVLRETQVGFIAFDARHLELCGTIAQHVSAALLNSRLYREASEGRRLAEEASYLKSRFLSMVSHELRTPLSVIVGLSELMLREQAEGKPVASEDLQRIFTSSQHLGFLIRDVLDLASSDAGRLRLTLEPLDLVEILQSAMSTGEQLAHDKGLNWQIRLPKQHPWIMGDAVRLRQVTLNLLTNAVKFTEQGAITLTVEMDGEQVTVSISDTGLGIPLDERGIIFDEFRQSGRTAARGFGGLGLGLAISRHLIELHDGVIGVTSSGVEGEGATFYYTLPLLGDQMAAPLSPQTPKHTVLLLTDQSDSVQYIQEYLQRQGLGLDIQLVNQNADWTPQALDARPAAILFDRQVLSAQSWDFIRRLKSSQETQDLPILFYSLPSDGEHGSALELDYQAKPLSAQQLTRILAKPIAGGKSLQTILIVDDDLDILDLHSRLIKAQLPGCSVLVARDGREALDMLYYVHPDLVLLDLMMPEVDGFKVLEAMRSRDSTRDIPVIVLTAQALTEADMTSLNQGVIAVLEKGVFSADETLERIATALARTGRTGSAAQRLVRRAVSYIHSHYAEAVTREQLASDLAVSGAYLSNSFQKEMGISLMTYLNRYRIKQARRLLDESDLSITQVSLAVGFSDSGYFSRVFHREAGISPSAYRRGKGTL